MKKEYIKKALQLATELMTALDADEGIWTSTRTKAMQLIGYIQAMESLLEEQPNKVQKGLKDD